MPLGEDQPLDAEAGVSRNSPSAVTIGIAIAALYFGRDIFMPLAMAVLLSFMLAPVVAWLERLHVPRVPAVVAAVAMTFLVLSGLGVLIAGQLVQLAQEVPGYQTNLQEKIKAIKFIGGPDGVIGRTSEMLQELGDEVSRRAEPGTLARCLGPREVQRPPGPCPYRSRSAPQRRSRSCGW